MRPRHFQSLNPCPILRHHRPRTLCLVSLPPSFGSPPASKYLSKFRPEFFAHMFVFFVRFLVALFFPPSLHPPPPSLSLFGFGVCFVRVPATFGGCTDRWIGGWMDDALAREWAAAPFPLPFSIDNNADDSARLAISTATTMSTASMDRIESVWCGLVCQQSKRRRPTSPTSSGGHTSGGECGALGYTAQGGTPVLWAEVMSPPPPPWTLGQQFLAPCSSCQTT